MFHYSIIVYTNANAAGWRQAADAATRSTLPTRSVDSFARGTHLPDADRLNSEEEVRARIQDQRAAEAASERRGRFDRTVSLDSVHPLAMRTGRKIIDTRV